MPPGLLCSGPPESGRGSRSGQPRFLIFIDSSSSHKKGNIQGDRICSIRYDCIYNIQGDYIYDIQGDYMYISLFTLCLKKFIHSCLYHGNKFLQYYKETILKRNILFLLFPLMTELLLKNTCLKSLAWSLRKRMRGRTRSRQATTSAFPTEERADILRSGNSPARWWHSPPGSKACPVALSFMLTPQKSLFCVYFCASLGLLP